MEENKMIELSDDLLDEVAGGGELQVSRTGDKVITTCSEFVCTYCGRGKTAGKSGHHCERQGGLEFPEASWFTYTCSNCDKSYSCPNANRRLGIALPNG